MVCCFIINKDVSFSSHGVLCFAARGEVLTAARCSRCKHPKSQRGPDRSRSSPPAVSNTKAQTASASCYDTLSTSNASFLPPSGCKSISLFTVVGKKEGVQQLRRLRSVAFLGRSGLTVKIIFQHRSSSASFITSSTAVWAGSYAGIALACTSPVYCRIGVIWQYFIKSKKNGRCPCTAPRGHSSDCWGAGCYLLLGLDGDRSEPLSGAQQSRGLELGPLCLPALRCCPSEPRRLTALVSPSPTSSAPRWNKRAGRQQAAPSAQQHRGARGWR